MKAWGCHLLGWGRLWEGQLCRLLKAATYGSSNLNEIQLKIQFLGLEATFQGLSSHVWLGTILLDSTRYRTFPSSQKLLLDSAVLQGGQERVVQRSDM